MGIDRGLGPTGSGGHRRRAAVALCVLAGALFAAPNALAGLYTVNSTSDTEGACTPAFCTLRQAMAAANGDPGSTIVFQLGIGGSYTISPSSPLPVISAPVTIDATTQTGYAGAPLIELDGSSIPDATGMNVTSAGVEIRGFAVNRFHTGIALNEPGGDTIVGNYVGINASGGVEASNAIGIGAYTPGNTIGGSTAADRNVISGNTQAGIEIAFGTSNTVTGNYIGTDASGSFGVANAVGITVGSDSNTIGDAAEAGKRNVISGNSSTGVEISGASVNTIRGNYVGTDASGVTAVPNGSHGIHVIGGESPANTNTIENNVVSGNAGDGVRIEATTPNAAGNNVVQGNLIGTDWTGKNPLGNTGAGVFIVAGSGIGNNTIGGLANTIAYNAKGISAGMNTARNKFTGNSIHDNTGPGIDLDDDGPTANDEGDGDTGANELINYPVLSGLSRDATGAVTLDIAFDGALPDSQVDIEFFDFDSPTCGEGRTTSLGTLSAIADGSGDLSFNDADIGFVRGGTSISATATDTFNDTSELSPCVSVGSLPGASFTVTTSAVAGDGVCDSACTLPEAMAAANGTPGMDTIAFDLPDPSLPISPTDTDPLPPITDDVVIDGTTQPGTTPGTPQVQVDGSLSPSNPIGFDIQGGFGTTAVDGSVIRGLSITGFASKGISLDGPPSVVEGNYIGLAPDGSAAPNGSGGFSNGGIEIRSGDNRVGGTTAAQRNVISGNDGKGIDFTNASNNSVVGNFIGTTVGGTGDLGNTSDGIGFEDVSFQTVGGSAAGAGNVISGNGENGIFLNAGYEFAPAIIQGNTIGLNAAGDAAIPNGSAGIRVESVDDVHIGGATAGAGNVISGNLGEGVFLDSSDGAQIQGNLIGLDGAGGAGIPNGTGQLVLSSSDNAQIGGTTPGARNVIGGSVSGNGILLDSGSNGNAIQGNYVGTDATGEVAVGNADGINLSAGSANNTIGGVVPGARNVISGSNGPGIRLDLAGTGNRILGNSIGTDKDETDLIPNDVGIELDNTDGTQIGATSPGAGNVIAGSPDVGILVFIGSDSNIFAGNFIGTNRADTLDLGNGDGMRFVNGGGSNNLIGPSNVFAHNLEEGIELDEGAGNRISANSFHDNGGKGILLAVGANNDQAAPVITSATKSGSTTSIDGTLTSAGLTSFFIEYFVTPSCAGQPQGKTYLGFQSVTTDDSGHAPISFSSNVPGLGEAITATATSQTTGSTSEFSSCATVTAAVVATDLSLTPTPTSSQAGVAQVKLADTPPLALILSQAGLQPAPVNQSPVNQSPVNQTPINQTAASNAPVNQTPINQTPVNQTPVNQSGFAELTQSISQLGSIPISTIPLLRTGGWAALLAGTSLAGLPEQSVTLRDVYALNPPPAPLQPGATNPIKIGELDLSRSPIGTIAAIAFALGKVPLSEIDTATGTFTDWCTSANVTGVDCTGTTSSPATVLSTNIQGAPVNQSPVNQSPVNQSLIQALAAYGAPVNQTPVNQTPINQSQIGALPVNQTPVNQTPVNQTPINQLSLQPILAANAPVNQSPVNQTPVNQLSNPNDLFFCSPPEPSGPNTIDCSTATLKDAVNAVRPGVTLGDLRIHAPASLLASWTIADLRYFGNMTIGDLLVSLPQPNNFTLADVLLLVLGSPTGVQELSFEGINIFDTALQQVATGGSTVGYRAQFTVSPNGGPSGDPSTVDVSSTVASGFLYESGSSRLVPGTSCTGATAIADPAATTLNDGRLKLTWSVDTIVGDTYSLCFTVRPGLILGPKAASLDAQPDGGTTASATGTTLNVGDTLEANDTAGTSPLISNDSFYLSYLTNASDVDYYRFTAPATGTVVTFHLSHLPTDYDLVVYGPAGTALRPPLTTGAVPLDEAPVTDSGVDVTSTTGTLPSQTLDDLRLQTDLPMVGVSASRGTDPEDVVVISQGAGTYTVQITGYNGATSPKPYMLRVATTPPRVTSTVSARTITGTVGPALPPLPANLNTVFLVNRQQMEGIYGSMRATNVINALSSNSAAFAALGFPNVILSVDRDPAVQSAYTAWNAAPGSPAAANGVVKAINGVIDAQIRSQPNGAGLKYLVVVGGDQVIPFARLDDFTVTANNESGYASAFGTNTDLFATLNAGQMLSDDPLGDVNPVPYLTRQLYIPELAVGRLVETPEEIVSALNRFVSPTVSGRLDPTTSLTTGYDFLYDGAQGVNSPFGSRFGANAKTLLDNPATPGDSWTLSQLIGAFLPTASGTSAPSISSLNGHGSHFQFEPPKNDVNGAREPLFTTSALTSSSSSLTNRLIFSMACHLGLSVADAVVTGTTLDWPQAFAQKGAGAFLGNTGYGYGDSLVVAYSEELNKLLAQRIAAGSTVGDALTGAKQAYYGELGVFGVYDEKSMAEFTLYGLPMWKVSGPPAGGAAAAEALVAPESATAAAAPTDASSPAEPDAVITDPTTGLDAETFSVNPTNTPHSTADGTYWSGPDGVQVTHLRPLQPKAFVGLTGTSGHSALITELTSGDTNCVNPVFARPIVDLTENERELRFADVAFPSKLQTVRTFETPTGRLQQLVLVTGQFFTQTCSSDPDPQLGVQRLFSHIAGRVFRSSSTDYFSPGFQLTQATQVGGNAAFVVDVTDKTPSGAGTVKQVLVGLRSGADANWTFVNLAQSATNPARWTGGAPISGSQFEYFVQAVDAAGNVAVSTNKGFYFVGAPAPPPPSGDVTATVSGAPTTNGWFTAPPTLAITKPADVTVEASVDGGAYAAPPSTITGDGVHTIDIRASNGDTVSLIAPVDTTAPEIVIGTPANGGQYVLDSVVPADYFCRDSGSGVAASTPCTGTVPNGQSINTSSVGTKTFTVQSINDVAGHSTPAKTVTYTVVYRPIVFSSGRTGDGDIYTVRPDGTGLTRLTPTAGLDEQPAWSPDGSKIAFASERNKAMGSGLDIYVMDANGQNVTRLTTSSGDDTAPSWSPDGTKIAFQSKRDGNPEIYVMNANGTGQTRLTNNTKQDAEPAWSPNLPGGQKIAFLSDRNGTLNVWVMDANGANQTQLTATTQPDGTPAWSPDGSKILFASKRVDNKGTVFDLYTMKPDGTNIVRLTTGKAGDFEGAWSRDGLKIAFTSLRDRNQEIYNMNANGSGQTRVTTNAAFDRQPGW